LLARSPRSKPWAGRPGFGAAARDLVSATFIAHVRHASTGANTYQNTHPFVDGAVAFAHNGALAGLDLLEAYLGPAMGRVHGDTDSEPMFALILTEPQRTTGTSAPTSPPSPGSASPPRPCPTAQIALQMVVLGSGLGLTTAPATESIMGAVRPEQAGVGSAVNDATRELGGTLGVAVIGSVYASLYRHSLDAGGLPGPVRETARSSYAAARSIAGQLPAQAVQLLTTQADAGFLSGLHAGCRVGAGVCAAGMLAVLAFLPARPQPAPAGLAQEA